MVLILATKEWSLSVGDPTVLGWTICMAYAGVAWMSLCVGARMHTGRREGLARFWLALSLVLLVLAINKQLDLQRLITQIARETARSQGWYRARKPFQFAVLSTVLVFTVGVMAWIGYALRLHLRAIWPAIVGFLVISAYIAMRATSHHDVDALMRAGPLPLRDSMELVGIALIGWAALRFLLVPDRSRS